MGRVRGAVWRFFLITVAASLAVVFLAACGGGGGSSSSGQAVQVTEKEWSITIGSTTLTNGQGNATLKAGDTTFNIRNTGTVAHALEIKGQGIDKKTGDIDPGKSESLTVNLKAGTYEVWCPIPGHKENGMDGHVTVS